ncbi:non-ribosomal peptide synthetase [Actinoplanes sp. NPDC051851]|uniref:non-ribosomal peptide synthetase n=1 Tax=Actinoplanes sp. NPDC051851 TaxID=3154753 RepID=UPI00343CD450
MKTIQSTVIAVGAELPEPADRVCDVVMRQARRDPDHPAVVCGDVRHTYGELAAAAVEVARRIEADGYGARSKRIAVPAVRAVTTVAHLLGISYSGRSFVPVDPQAPSGTADHVRAAAGLFVSLDPETGGVLRHGEPGDAAHAADSSLSGEAYVLFTSGSTGLPKGVAVSQYNLATSTEARLAVYRPSPASVFLLLSPFHFDSAMAGLWGTLSAGGTLVVARESERRDPDALLRLIAEHGVTDLLTVPSFYREMLAVWGRDAAGSAALASLRTVICAGEALGQHVIDRHFAMLPEVRLANEYGPTECTVWSTYRIYDRPGRPTIGHPIPGSTLHLLDDRRRPVPPGAAGQIAVSGPGVAAGYVADRQRTEARFVVLAEGPTGATRCYLTGDVGRWSPEEGLEFAGRLDNEIKIRGVRIAAEAVEEALAAHPGVQAVAVAYDAEAATSYAFVVAAPDRTPDPAAIRSTGRAALGAAAVPDRVILVEAFPRTAHDKIDRAALLAAARRPAAATADRDRGLAERVAQAWAETLGVEVRDDTAETFFELGGNSLTVLRLTRALGAIAGRRIGVKDVYHAGTIALQTELLTAGGGR